MKSAATSRSLDLIVQALFAGLAITRRTRGTTSDVGTFSESRLPAMQLGIPIICAKYPRDHGRRTILVFQVALDDCAHCCYTSYSGSYGSLRKGFVWRPQSDSGKSALLQESPVSPPVHRGGATFFPLAANSRLPPGTAAARLASECIRP